MKVKDLKDLDLKDYSLLAFESDMTIDEIFDAHERTGEKVRTGPAMIVIPEFFDGFVRDYGDVEVIELRRDPEGYWWLRVEADAVMHPVSEINADALA